MSRLEESQGWVGAQRDEAAYSPFADETLPFDDETDALTDEVLARSPALVRSPFLSAFETAAKVGVIEPEADEYEYDEGESLAPSPEPESEAIYGSVLGGVLPAGETEAEAEDVGETDAEAPDDAFAEPIDESYAEPLEKAWTEESGTEFVTDEEFGSETFLEELDEEDTDDVEAALMAPESVAEETHTVLAEAEDDVFDDEFDLLTDGTEDELYGPEAPAVNEGEATPPPMRPLVQPMAVPPANPIDFAPIPSPGSYWPIVTRHPRGREVNYRGTDDTLIGSIPGRRFLAGRSKGKRYHLGVDLFASYGDPVVACEAGRVVSFYGFCCGKNKTSYALIVEHANVVINYGEVAPDSLRRAGLEKGSPVRAGQVIGYVGRNPGGSSMLHFETYVPGTRSNKRWVKGGGRRPSEVLNPTKYLVLLQQFGLVGSTAPPMAGAPSGEPGLDVERAIRRNRHWRNELGWDAHEQAIGWLLGFTDMTPDEHTFAEAVADWQHRHGLEDDGIIGPKTWARMRPLLGLTGAPATSAPSGNPAPGALGTLEVDPVRFGLPVLAPAKTRGIPPI